VTHVLGYRLIQLDSTTLHNPSLTPTVKHISGHRPFQLDSTKLQTPTLISIARPIFVYRYPPFTSPTIKRSLACWNAATSIYDAAKVPTAEITPYLHFAYRTIMNTRRFHEWWKRMVSFLFSLYTTGHLFANCIMQQRNSEDRGNTPKATASDFCPSEYKFRTSVHFWLNVCNETSQNKRVFNRTQSWHIILILACKQHPGTCTRRAAPQFTDTNRTERENYHY
jgi:hypothetical protein